MFNYVVFNHHLGNRLDRENVLRKCESGNYQEALDELNALIEKHVISYSQFYPNRTEKLGEKLDMEHAKRHLEAVIDFNDPSYIDAEGNIKHQSDIVKAELVKPLKQNY